MINVYTEMMAIVLLGALLLRGNLPRKKAFILFACIAMFILLGFRDAYSIGNDSASSYLHEFQRMEKTDWTELPMLLDWGNNAMFHRLMKWVHEWSGGDYQKFIILISAFVMLALGVILYRYSCNPVQSVIYYWGLLYYSFQFNALKQSMAMAFILLAFDAIMLRKPVRFVLLVLLAAQFHFPAIVFIPAYWITKIKIGRSYLILLGFVLAGTYLFREKIVDLMLDVYDTTIYESNMRFLANKVIVMLMIVTAALVLRRPTADDRLYSSLIMFAGIAIVLQTFAGYNNTFERLADYYFQFAILLLPLIFETETTGRSMLAPRQTYMAKAFGPIVFGLFGIWRFANSLQSTVAMLPYKFGFHNLF